MSLIRFTCVAKKCEYTVKALPSSTCWCPNGHRMLTDKQIAEKEERRLKRLEKKNG